MEAAAVVDHEAVEEPADDVVRVREIMVRRGHRGDLRPFLRSAEQIPSGYDFEDIHPAYRNGLGNFNNKVLGIPIAGESFFIAYRKDLFDKYGSERLVLAAYNAGQGNVDRWRANGEPIQFAETRAYVARMPVEVRSGTTRVPPPT